MYAWAGSPRNFGRLLSTGRSPPPRGEPGSSGVEPRAFWGGASQPGSPPKTRLGSSAPSSGWSRAPPQGSSRAPLLRSRAPHLRSRAPHLRSRAPPLRPAEPGSSRRSRGARRWRHHSSRSHVTAARGRAVGRPRGAGHRQWCRPSSVRPHARGPRARLLRKEPGCARLLRGGVRLRRCGARLRRGGAGLHTPAEEPGSTPRSRGARLLFGLLAGTWAPRHVA